MDGSQLHSTLRGWLIKTVCTNNSRRVYTNVVTRVCGSVGRLNPTTVVQMYRSKWWKFTFWNFAAVPVAYVHVVVGAPNLPKQYWPHPTCQNAMESYLPTCINPCKSGDGSCLKKIDLPTEGGGGRSGNFRGSTNQKSKLREMSWIVQKIYKKKFFLHIPPRGVPGRGSTFKKSGKFHELSRKSIKKTPPPPTNRGRSGNFRGSKNQKSKLREMSWIVQKIYKKKFFLHIPPRGVPGRGSTFKKSGKFHELSRKSIKKTPPPPTNRGRSGNFRGSKNQKTGKCHELSRKSIKQSPPPTKGSRSGNFRGSKNQKSGKCHELQRKVINKN